MNKTLEEKINAYYEAKQKADKAKEIAETLGKELKELLEENQLTNATTENGITASLVNKTTFKYLDEIAVKNYLKNNKMESYITENIDAKKLNVDLKKSELLFNALKDYIQKDNSNQLTLKKIETLEDIK